MANEQYTYKAGSGTFDKWEPGQGLEDKTRGLTFIKQGDGIVVLRPYRFIPTKVIHVNIGDKVVIRFSRPASGTSFVWKFIDIDDGCEYYDKRGQGEIYRFSK